MINSIVRLVLHRGSVRSETHHSNHIDDMTKRKNVADLSQSSPDNSLQSARKKPKGRPTRIAAQRARDAVHEEAQPDNSSDLSEAEVLRMLTAKNRRKSGSKASAKAVAPSKASRVTPSRKGVGRSNKKDSAIQDYFQSSPRPKNRETPVEGRPSPARGSHKPITEDTAALELDGDDLDNDSQRRPESEVGRASDVCTLSKPPRPVRSNLELEEPSDIDEPRGFKSSGTKNVQDSEPEDSDDDVPDDFGPVSARGKVVKVEDDDDGSSGDGGQSDHTPSLCTIPASETKKVSPIEILSESEEDDNDETSPEDRDPPTDAIVRCLTKLMARSAVNDARTRIILKEINEIRSKLEDVLFKVSSVENCVEDVRANNNATNNGGHNKRSGKKSEGVSVDGNGSCGTSSHICIATSLQRCGKRQFCTVCLNTSTL